MKPISMIRRTVPMAAMAAALLACHGAQAANNDTATATAVVLTPIAVAKNADLVFGNVVGGNGDVTVSTAGARTKTGTTPLPSGITPAAARFDVTGTGTQGFSISYTGTATQLVSGSDNMAFAYFAEVTATTTPTGVTTGQPATGALTSGAASIHVGGTVTVGASQAAGTYTGNVVVTVDYN